MACSDYMSDAPISSKRKVGLPFTGALDARRNRTGRPRGFGKLIRDTFGESGEKLMEGVASIALGEMRAQVWVFGGPEMGPVEVETSPSIRERLDAYKFLSEHAFGKAPASVNITGTVNHVARHDLSKLSDREMDELASILERVELDDGETVEGELLTLPEGQESP